MPDNRHVVVSRQTSAGEETHLWYADTQSQSMTQLTFSTIGERSPAVSPDGKSVLFGQEKGSMDVVATAIADGSTTTLVHTGWKETNPLWATKAEVW